MVSRMGYRRNYKVKGSVGRSRKGYDKKYAERLIEVQDSPDSCTQCVNLKTMIVNTRNISTMKFHDLYSIIKRLRKDDELRIYWCSQNMLEREYYISRNIMHKIKVDCPRRDKFDVEPIQ